MWLPKVAIQQVSHLLCLRMKTIYQIFTSSTNKKLLKWYGKKLATQIENKIRPTFSSDCTCTRVVIAFSLSASNSAFSSSHDRFRLVRSASKVSAWTFASWKNNMKVGIFRKHTVQSYTSAPSEKNMKLLHLRKQHKLRYTSQRITWLSTTTTWP